MLYVEYEKCKQVYLLSQEKYDKILREKEALFYRTQPGSTSYDKEIVVGGSVSNKFDEYLTIKDQKRIDERLKEAKELLEEREVLFKMKERDLKESKDIEDIIYVYSYIYKLTTRKIEQRIAYSQSSITRKLKKIKKNIKMVQNDYQKII
jgi:hypothetical protein